MAVSTLKNLVGTTGRGVGAFAGKAIEPLAGALAGSDKTLKRKPVQTKPKEKKRKRKSTILAGDLQQAENQLGISRPEARSSTLLG